MTSASFDCLVHCLTDCFALLSIVIIVGLVGCGGMECQSDTQLEVGLHYYLSIRHTVRVPIKLGTTIGLL
jgi:hypothetical protein